MNDVKLGMGYTMKMKNGKAFFILLFSQVIYSLFLFIWMLFSFMSMMMFDAPGWETNWGLLALFSFIIIYPAVLILAVIMSWLSYKKEKYRRAYIWDALPFLWFIPILAMIFYSNFS